MSYIGVQPGVGQYRKLDDISGSFNGSTTTFTTSVAGENVTAISPQQLIVSVGGVIQQPVTDYTTSTNSIIFSTAPGSGLDFFAVLMGDAINIGTPSDGSVTTAKLGADLTVDLASGTAAAPSLTFDSNTGLFSPGADEVAISTGGSQRATVDSSGRLLVGTSSSTGVNITTFQGNSSLSTGTGIVNIALGNTSPGTTDELGRLQFTDSGHNSAAQIVGQRDSGTWNTSTSRPTRLVFSTTADGASSPTEAMRINSFQQVLIPSAYNDTTASAANVQVTSAGRLNRSTSSIKYKTNVETLEDRYADALLECRPVWYQSTCEADNPNWGWWGFIAEEVAEIDPRLVHWKTVEVTYDEKGSAVETPCDPEPEGVAYDRFVPHLLNLIKRQGEAIADLQAEVVALKAQ